MKLLCIIILCLPLITVIESNQHVNVEDNEFAEFEEFDEDEVVNNVHIADPTETPNKNVVNEKSSPKSNVADKTSEEVDSEDVVVEDDDNEFEHFHDEEEFEGFEDDKILSTQNKLDDTEGPKITIAKVPLHFRYNWDSYILEILMLAGLFVYFINFFTGKAKNSKMANAWFNAHRSILDENFALVGDDGQIEVENNGLMKESEHMYTLWCSGRTCCEGMLVELKFIKRQDLVAVLAQMMRPVQDQVIIKVELTKEESDNFVMCVASKKTGIKLAKEMADLSIYCPERRSADKYDLPSNFSVMSEIPEATSTILDSRTSSFINKYANIIDFIHISDQFSGPKQQEDTTTTELPPTKKMLIVGLNIPVKGRPLHEAIDSMKPVMNLVFYLMEKIKRLKLSKEAKTKSDKNRARVEENFMKTTHAARAEAAAARREEKKRLEKERILQEDDPEKQRKWEEKELKRQMKKKAPKMKQLKVKAL